MSQTDLFFYVCGGTFGFFGYAYLEDSRRNIDKLGSKVFIIPFAGYFCYEHGRTLLQSGDRISQAIALLAIFCVASPFVGYIWYGKGGSIRRGLIRLVSFILLWLVLSVVFFILRGEKLKDNSFICTFLLACLAFLAPKIRKALKRRKSNSAYKKQLNARKKAEISERQRKAEERRRDEAILEQIIEEMKK